MAGVIVRPMPTISKDGCIRIVPLGDVHIGAAACDEDHIKSTVKYIKQSGAYWVGMGDYCEFINKKDKRFTVSSLAPWIGISDLADLARAQRDRFLEIVEPLGERILGRQNLQFAVLAADLITRLAQPSQHGR